MISCSAIQSRGIFTTAFTNTQQGTWSDKLPEGIVMLILGAQISQLVSRVPTYHCRSVVLTDQTPWQNLCQALRSAFEEMWKEAGNNSDSTLLIDFTNNFKVLERLLVFGNGLIP